MCFSDRIAIMHLHYLLLVVTLLVISVEGRHETSEESDQDPDNAGFGSKAYDPSTIERVNGVMDINDVNYEYFQRTYPVRLVCHQIYS